MIKTITNIGGKQRWIITIPGLIIIWFIAAILMPKNCNKKDKIKTEGVWYNKQDSEFTKIEIKSTGYFYYDIVPSKGKSIQYKGMIDTDKEKADTLLLVSFNADTLLFAKIESVITNILTVKNLNNNSITRYQKQ